jgi:large subunit ribosomal protein L25
VALLELEVQTRTQFGKHVRHLRREGIIPANVYGHGIKSTAIQAPERDLERLLQQVHGAALVMLRGLPGPARHVLVRRVTRVPTTSRLEHVDFFNVHMREKLRADIPLRFVGTSTAVEKLDGTLMRALDHLRVECLPGDLPETIDVDVSSLADLDAALHVADLRVPDGVTVLNDPTELVAKVLPPAVEEVAAAPAEAAAAPTEPVAVEAPTEASPSRD